MSLDRRARGLVAPNGSTTVPHVEFRVLGVTYALPAKHVRRSLEAGVSGDTIEHLGAEYPVRDLRRLFDPGADRTPGFLLLTETESRRAALQVDAIGRLRSIDGDRLLPLPELYQGPERDWIVGLIEDAPLSVVVDAPALLTALMLAHSSAEHG